MFREVIVKREINILKMDIVEHIGDLFTKSLTRTKFEYLRSNIMGC